jgi:hypothetical protein
MDPEKLRILREAERQGKIYVAPTALQRSSQKARRYFRNNEEVREEAFRQLHVFPARLLDFWRTSERGYVVLAETGGEYDPRIGIATCSLRYLMFDAGVLQEEFVHLLDHLLGSGGKGGRLSEGEGANTSLADMGRTIQCLFRSHQFVNAYARENAREYLAQSVRAFLRDPAVLQVNDPQMYEFVAACFLNEDVWREVLNP